MDKDISNNDENSGSRPENPVDEDPGFVKQQTMMTDDANENEKVRVYDERINVGKFGLNESAEYDNEVTSAEADQQNNNGSSIGAIVSDDESEK